MSLSFSLHLSLQPSPNSLCKCAIWVTHRGDAVGFPLSWGKALQGWYCCIFKGHLYVFLFFIYIYTSSISYCLFKHHIFLITQTKQKTEGNCEIVMLPLRSALCKWLFCKIAGFGQAEQLEWLVVSNKSAVSLLLTNCCLVKTADWVF